MRAPACGCASLPGRAAPAAPALGACKEPDGEVLGASFVAGWVRCTGHRGPGI